VDAVAALRAGLPVLLPTDGVYGLCCALDEEAVLRLYELKRREARQPTAIIAATIDALLEVAPELDADAVLLGPYTTILPNPAHRFRWLTGDRPETLGVRVPILPPAAREVLDAVGVVVATSANDPGEAAPASLDEVPLRIRAACAAEVDAGRLSGVASTVVDVTGSEPVVLRSGSGSYPTT
jgi:L-threonylcarbamoyladenylate synthase